MAKLLFGASLALLSLVVACAPKAPPPVPATIATTAQAPAPTPVPKLSAEDAAWAKVVATAKKEGLVTVYGSSQFAGPKGPASAQAFQKRYGIRVEMLIMAGRQQVEKVSIEQRLKQPIADVVSTGTSSATELSLAGMVEPVWQELPELKDKNVFKVDPIYTPRGDVLWMALDTAGPNINTNLVKPEDEPRSYYDLLKPRWKKNIIISDPRGGGGGGFNWFSVMLAYGVLDANYFRKFAEQEPLLWGGSSTEELKMVARGEYAMGHSGTTPGSNLIIEGAPLRILGMKEGNIVLGDAIAMIKGAAHPNAARLFVNYMLSQEGHTVYIRAGAQESMRQDVPDALDPRVEVKPPPQKILMRTYEIAEKGNQYHKERIAESIFGRK